MWLLWLVACGPEFEEGQIERGQLNCQLQDICGNLDAMGYDAVGDCEAASAAQSYNEDALCPEYRPDQMKKCLNAYEDAIEARDCAADFTRTCDVCSG